MTHRPPKKLFYEEHAYELLGDASGQLPMFEFLDIYPNAFTTAGDYFPVYGIRDKTLYLDSIIVAYSHTLEELSELHSINGVRPTSDNETMLFIGYTDIAMVMPINGYIILGRELSNGNANYKRSVTDYQIVKKILFSDGQITSIEDISEIGKEIRLLRAETEAKIKSKKEELRILTGDIRGMWI